MTLMVAHRLVVLSGAVVVFGLAACNTRQEVFSTPTSATPTGPPLPTPAPAVLLVAVSPRALPAGGSGTGTITLSLPASAGGTLVDLSATHDVVAFSTPVVVPAGSESITFPFRATAPIADTEVRVIASTPGRTVSAPLMVWVPLPVALSLVSDAGDFIGRGGVHRLIPPAATFNARCLDSEIEVTAERSLGDYFRVSIGAPRGTPLRVGTYENATRTAFRAPGTPGIDVGGQGRGCNQTSGAFVVHELDWTASTLNRMWVSFEQHCERGAPALRGDLRVVDLPLPRGSESCRR